VVAESVKGELLVVDWVEDGGRKGPPVNVKCEENGAVPIRDLVLAMYNEILRVGRHVGSSIEGI
jgi:hypothetical protein